MNQDIESIIERANRMQDGMTVNRNAFARDVVKIAKELQNWRNAHARAEPENKKEEALNNAFADILKGRFK